MKPDEFERRAQALRLRMARRRLRASDEMMRSIDVMRDSPARDRARREYWIQLLWDRALVRHGEPPYNLIVHRDRAGLELLREPE